MTDCPDCAEAEKGPWGVFRGDCKACWERAVESIRTPVVIPAGAVRTDQAIEVDFGAGTWRAVPGDGE
jgi:hypothetical protein